MAARRKIEATRPRRYFLRRVSPGRLSSLRPNRSRRALNTVWRNPATESPDFWGSWRPSSLHAPAYLSTGRTVVNEMEKIALKGRREERDEKEELKEIHFAIIKYLILIKHLIKYLIKLNICVVI